MFIEYQETLTPLDVIEDFESGITEFWTQYNANNSYGWSPFYTENGPDCSPTNCVMINHFAISQSGDEAELITPKIDLTTALSAILEYDYAYTKWGGSYEDGFRIDISADCWESYDTLFYAFGDDLITVPSTNDDWYPADCADWSTNNAIDLSTYLGQSVALRFVGINGYGNNFFLDNINIMGQMSGVDELDVPFSIYPNPSKGQFTVRHALLAPKLIVYAADGRIVYNQILHAQNTLVDLDVKAGIYIVHVNDGQKTYIDKVTIN